MHAAMHSLLCLHSQVFTDLSHIKMNATKSMIGHCLGAGAVVFVPSCMPGLCAIGAHSWLSGTSQYSSMLEVDGVIAELAGRCLQLCAAGGMEAIATIQAMRTGWVHPTINHVSCRCNLSCKQPPCLQRIWLICAVRWAAGVTN